MRYGENLTFIPSAGTPTLFYAGRANTAYWLDDATGLSGLAANIYTTKGAGQDGETFSASNIAKRQITVEGKILAGYHNQTVYRRALLRNLRAKAPGKLVYNYGDLTCYIPCYVSQAPIYSNDPTVRFQVVFDCPNPFWRLGTGEKSRTDIAAWVPNIEFPWEIVDDEIEIEYRSQSLTANVRNDGDADVGMMIVFRATGATSNPEIANVDTGEYIRLDFDMLAGDVITINTAYGGISATLQRGGVTSNVFTDVEAGSELENFKLFVGDNLLRYDASDTDALEVSLYYDVPLAGV